MSNMAGPSAAENVGLVWNPPPHPDPSRLDVWFLAGSQRSPPVPFFPEVHEELTRLWKAPFTARNKSGLWLLPPHHPWWWSRFGVHGNPLCGVVCGYATMSAEPGLPARACKYSSGLTGSAYRTCGEAASALHTMAILQVHQAKAFRDLHEGGHDLVFLHELHAATDLALRATNGYAHSQLPRRLAQTCTVLQAVVCTQGPGAQAPQPAGPLGQLGKEQTQCHAEDLFSRHRVWFGQPNSTPHPETCSVGAELLQGSFLYQAGQQSHWNSFRGSWGIWLQLRRQFRSVCSIWNRFSTGSMAESRGGCGNSELTGFRLHRPAAKPSARGQIPHDFGLECPGSRYPDMLWYSRMPRPPAGEPRTTGELYQGFERVPNCVGISFASSCWQYALPWATSEGGFSARTFWSVRTTRRPLRISTNKAVYAPVACRNSPATSSSGVRSIWCPFVPCTSQECSIGQPTCCLEQHFQASGDSIPRRFSWFGDGSELLRWTCLHLHKPPTARSFTP